jgi:hypothetical protein
VTSEAEIRSLTAELRACDPRLVLVKRLLFIAPCTHWVRGLYFDRTGYKEMFRLYALVFPLYVPTQGIWFGPGWEADRPPPYRGGSYGRWETTWPDCGQRLTQTATDELLPEIERGASAADFLGFLRRHKPLNRFEDEYLLTSALIGDLQDASRRARQSDDERYQSDPLARPREGRLASIFGDGQERTNRVLETFEYVMGLDPVARRRNVRLAAIFDGGQERTNRVLRTFERVMARRLGVEKWWSWEPVVGS